MNPPHESPEITLNSWLLIFCIFFAAGACWLGSVGQWHQVGPATVAALFLIMCAPFIASGGKRSPWCGMQMAGVPGIDDSNCGRADFQ